MIGELFYSLIWLTLGFIFICFLLLCFSFISSQTSSLAVAGKLMIPKIYCVFLFILWQNIIRLSFYNLKKKNKVRNRVFTTRSCFGWFHITGVGGVYKRLNPAYGLNPRVFMSVTKYYSTQNSMDTSPKCISCRLHQFLVTSFQEEEKKKKAACNKTGYNVLFIA